MKKNVLLRILAGAALSVCFSAAPVLAQAPPSGGPSGPTKVPIDGGASLLLASGVALSLKKLRDRKKLRDSQRIR